MVERDHYEVLGVAPGASAAEVKAAYRTQAKRLHPDRHHAEDATEQFRRLNQAYEVLSDPTRREHFDWLRRQRADEEGNATVPLPRSTEAPSSARGEARRRRAHRHATARRTREHAKRNLAKHSAWLDDPEEEEASQRAAPDHSQATLWLAALLLSIIAALLASSRLG